MNNNRAKRYSDKIEHIKKQISQIRDWTKDLSFRVFQKNDLTKLAVYEAYQESVVSSLDIIAMLCKDSGITPKEDYTNLETLSSREIIRKDIATVLAEGLKLRTRINQQFSLINDKKAFIEITESLNVFEEFIEGVEEWIKKNLVR